jgi:3'(2'), 5'-bisphosphate nucleotidase
MESSFSIDLKDPQVEFALDAVRRASLLVKKIQAEMVSAALTKEDRSPVTVADYAAQALVGHLMEEKFPQDSLMAEEDSAALQAEPDRHGSTLRQVEDFLSRVVDPVHPADVRRWIDRGAVASPPRRFWTLDPIDGTKGFLRGDQYAVALALLEDGEVRIGVLGCPNLVLTSQGLDGNTSLRPDLNGAGSLVLAVKGWGAWATALENPGEFHRLRVSNRSGASQARLLRSFESGHTNVDQIEEFSNQLGIHATPLRMDSQAKYAVLACGEGDLLVRLLSPKQPDYREKIWDQAAGALVVQEAGGKITDLDGRDLDFTTGRLLINNRGVLASNGLLHEAALQALQQISA